MVAAVLALLFMIPAGSVRADEGRPPDLLEGIDFEQKLNALVPLDTNFYDESGQEVQLDQYFHARPVILVFAYYECPMLCTLVLNDLTESLTQVRLSLGQDFDVITVSIDPTETSELAAEKKAVYLEVYGRPEAGAGWHFLTGDQANIDRLTEAVGFHYFYDESIEQYAHPTGVMVLTPAGVVSHYFFGLDYPANELRLGLVEASQHKIGNPVDQFFLYCYHYDPVTGRYSLAIENILRLAGMATVVIVAGGVAALIMIERRTSKYGITGDVDRHKG